MSVLVDDSAYDFKIGVTRLQKSNVFLFSSVSSGKPREFNFVHFFFSDRFLG